VKIGGQAEGKKKTAIKESRLIPNKKIPSRGGNETRGKLKIFGLPVLLLESMDEERTKKVI